MAYTKVTGALVGSLSDLDLTNVGDIQLDSITGDGDTNTSITFSGSDVITIATGGTTALTVDANQKLTANSGVAIDNITIDGTEIDLSSGDLTLDVAGDISLDADGGNVYIKDAGTTIGQFFNSANDFVIKSEVNDQDLVFKGVDNSANITALTLDMSDAGTATFNHDVNVGGNVNLTAGALSITADGNNAVTFTESSAGLMTIAMADDLIIDAGGDITLDADGGDIRFKDGGTVIGSLNNTSSDFCIVAGVQDKDILFKGDDGGSAITAMAIDMSAGGRVGIGTTSPDAQFHNEASAVTNVHYDTGASTILEATENVVQITAADSGNNACALILSTAPSSGNNKHWIFHHGGTSKGDRLDIGFGESSSTGFDGRGDIAADITINTDGHVGLGVTNVGDMHANYRNLIVGTGSGDEGMAIYSGAGNAGAIGFARDCANNTDAYDGYIEYNQSDRSMRFGTNAGNERMRIEGDGDVIINGTSAEAAGSCTWSIGARNPVQCFNASAYVQNSEFMTFRNQGTQIGSIIMSNTNATTYSTSSDYRLKENVSDMTGATAKLKQLKPKRFNWIADTTNTLQDGFLAHEVSPVVPEAIIGDKDAKDSDDNPIYQQIDHSKLVPLLVKTIQELEARITTLEG